MHRTEIVLVMGRELTMGESSTKLDRQQQNFSAHILLSWSVVLQGRPVRQNGGEKLQVFFHFRVDLSVPYVRCCNNNSQT